MKNSKNFVIDIHLVGYEYSVYNSEFKEEENQLCNVDNDFLNTLHIGKIFKNKLENFEVIDFALTINEFRNGVKIYVKKTENV